MPAWTRAQVEQLAPDDKALAAARKLARPGPWSDTGSTDVLVWGKCQGSGSTPYQVSVDLNGPAVKCTCPSRKFPCKHGLALLLLWSSGGDAFDKASEPAAFAADWARERDERATRSRPRDGDTTSDEPADPHARAERLARRLETMDAGVADFRLWLADVYRQGLAAARRQPYAFWDAAAARLVDAQIPGLAARVRALPARLTGRDDWADVALTETGRWHAAAIAWTRRDALGPADLGNLRAFLGWPVPSDEIDAGGAVRDTWVIEGVHRTDDGRLQSQRTWLRGTHSGARHVLLDFAAGGASLGVSQIVGSVVDASLVTWPGTGVRRARFVDPPVATSDPGAITAHDTLDDALGDAGLLLAANPFVDQVPLAVAAAFEPTAHGARIVDRTGAALPLTEGIDPWPILARTGDALVAVFGELDDGAFRPLAAQLARGPIAL